MGSCSYSTERKKEVHYTLVHKSTITAVYVLSSMRILPIRVWDIPYVYTRTGCLAIYAYGVPMHDIHSSAQYIHDTEKLRLSERQVASTMISVLAGTLTSRRVLGVVVKGAKKHYVKTEQTLSSYFTTKEL